MIIEKPVFSYFPYPEYLKKMWWKSSPSAPLLFLTHLNAKLDQLSLCGRMFVPVSSNHFWTDLNETLQ